MNNKTLKIVTITGADESINPKELIPLSEKYPFVEWAILLSESSTGKPRFPNRKWLNELFSIVKDHSVKLAGHICGSWVKNLVQHNSIKVFEENTDFLEMFPRIQLNFSPYSATPDFIEVLKPFENQFIFQIGKNFMEEKKKLLEEGSKDLNLAVLFDRSGGKGVLPEEWTPPLNSLFCGFAGGLGTETLSEQLPKIEILNTHQDFWIDMESKVRSEDNQLFDLIKVERCLEISKPFVG